MSDMKRDNFQRNSQKPYGKKPAGNGPRKPEGRYAQGRKPAPRSNTAVPQGPNARKIALEILTKVHKQGAFAGLTINDMMPKTLIKPEDRRLVTNLVYGTLENQLKLDYVIEQFTEHPAREEMQQDILRMGAYQILMLDRIPDSAAVNESVKLVKQMGMESSAGFINAVLRNLIRKKEELVWPDRENDPVEWLSIESSTPSWLVKRLVEAYGDEEAEKLLLYRESAHPTVMRPNMTKLSDADFEKLLEKKGLSFTRGVAPHAYLVGGAVDAGSDPDFRSGMYSIQGQSSILAAEAVEAKPGMRILDACAAPGGKSAYLCEKMQMTGRVFAWELHERRAQLLDGVKRRLSLDNLRVTVRDASDFREDLENTLDAVLLDAPCSGTGVMAEKPDIKHRLNEEDIAAIAETQKKILNTVCRYVKVGGTLVYSTCAILPEENRMQVEAFLENHPEYQLELLPQGIPEELRKMQGSYGLQLLPHRDHVEGFFIARMRRVR